MTSDDRRRRPSSAEASAGRPTFSSPDRFRQDKIEEEEKMVAKSEAKEERSRLLLARLKTDIADAERKSRDAKDKKKRIAQAAERAEDAGQFAQKMEEREKARKEALERGGPELPAKASG